MSFYLVDYENIKNIKGCDTLTANDTVVFFYTANADKLSFDLHKQLLRSPVKKEYFEAKCGGKNALDFQLSTYAGSLLTAYPEERVYIVANDKDYEYIVTFWKELGVNRLQIVKNIPDVPSEKAKESIEQKSSNEVTESAETASAQQTSTQQSNIQQEHNDTTAEAVEVEAAPPKKEADSLTVCSVLLKNTSLSLTEKQCEDIEKIVHRYKSKQAINNNIMKMINNSEKVGKIIKVIKPFLKNKK